MNGGEIFLLVLGPAIALAAGLMIYGLAVYDGRRPVRAVDGPGGPERHPQQR